MNDPRNRIRATLDGLMRRRLGLLMGEALARAVAAWCVALSLLLLFAAFVPIEAGKVVVAAIALAGVVAFFWDLPRWRAAVDRRIHAERVEALRPELRGVLLTVYDRAARPMGSPALLDLMAGRAADVLATTPAARAWPGGPFFRRSALALLTVLTLFIVAVDQDAAGTLRRFWAGPAPAPEAATVAQAAPPDAVLGDITLRYVYPAYTRLEPLEVPNSNGEVHAPPGTLVQIRARTAEDWTEAALRAYDTAVPAELAGERVVRGSLTVAGEGTWRFEFGERRSGEMKIVPEPDLPPDVTVQAPQGRVRLAADGQITLPYTARDDYGVTRVLMEVTVGKDRREIAVRAPADVPKLVGDRVVLSARTLELPVGTKATVRVGAVDNDEVSGQKTGWSAPVTVEVLGPNGTAAALWAFREGARDALLLVLADFLVEPMPPVDTPAAAARWGATVDERYAAYDQLVRDTWMSVVPKKPESVWMGLVSADRRALVGFARGLGNAETPLNVKDAATLVDLHAKNVATLENAILLLDQLLQQRALAELNKRAKELAVDANQLDTDMEALSAAQARARLDRLDRQFALLAKDVAKLDAGGLKEFVTDRTEEVQSLMEGTRRALAEGKEAEAGKKMERLAELLQEMADGIDEMQQRGGSRQNQLQDAMAALKEELEALQAAQEALRAKVEEARKQFGQDMDEAVQIWERIGTLAQQLSDGLSDKDPLVRRLRLTDRGMDLSLGDASASADGLRDSARARDAETARDRAENVGYDLERAAVRQEDIDVRDGGPSAEDVSAAATRIRQLDKTNTEILRLLAQLQGKGGARSQELRQALEQLAGEQQQIAERAQKAAEGAQQVSQQLPMGAPGLEEGAQRAAEQSARASEAMREGDAMEAEGGQRGTEDGLQEAQAALEQAQQNLQAMQRAAGGESGEEGKEGEEDDEGMGRKKDGGDGVGQDDDVMLPAPEEFQTPEEYRRALLQGMEAQVPTPYETAKRRYYEELVRQ